MYYFINERHIWSAKSGCTYFRQLFLELHKEEINNKPKNLWHNIDIDFKVPKNLNIENVNKIILCRNSLLYSCKYICRMARGQSSAVLVVICVCSVWEWIARLGVEVSPMLPRVEIAASVVRGCCLYRFWVVACTSFRWTHTGSIWFGLCHNRTTVTMKPCFFRFMIPSPSQCW